MSTEKTLIFHQEIVTIFYYKMENELMAKAFILCYGYGKHLYQVLCYAC